MVAGDLASFASQQLSGAQRCLTDSAAWHRNSGVLPYLCHAQTARYLSGRCLSYRTSPYQHISYGGNNAHRIMNIFTPSARTRIAHRLHSAPHASSPRTCATRRFCAPLRRIGRCGARSLAVTVYASRQKRARRPGWRTCTSLSRGTPARALHTAQ